MPHKSGALRRMIKQSCGLGRVLYVKTFGNIGDVDLPPKGEFALTGSGNSSPAFAYIPLSHDVRFVAGVFLPIIR